MNTSTIKIWNQLTKSDKQQIFIEAAAKQNLPPAAIEKDWWVVRTLELAFDTEIGPHTVFKGGTSLSKAWNLIAAIVSSTGNNEPGYISKARKDAYDMNAIENFKDDFNFDKPETGIGIICVCDRLLTGFDAPIEQV